MHVNLEGEFRLRITGIRGGPHIADVAVPAKPEQPAPVIEQLIGVGRCHSGALKVEERTGIDVAAAGTHHETLKRRHSQGGLN